MLVKTKITVNDIIKSKIVVKRKYGNIFLVRIKLNPRDVQYKDRILQMCSTSFDVVSRYMLNDVNSITGKFKFLESHNTFYLIMREKGKLRDGTKKPTVLELLEGELPRVYATNLRCF